jgi:hypothetical protein
VLIAKSNVDAERVQLLVFFDRNIHANGTQHCPYLAVKITAGDHTDNLMRSDYILVVTAINECVVLSLFVSFCLCNYRQDVTGYASKRNCSCICQEDEIHLVLGTILCLLFMCQYDMLVYSMFGDNSESL